MSETNKMLNKIINVRSGNNLSYYLLETLILTQIVYN